MASTFPSLPLTILLVQHAFLAPASATHAVIVKLGPLFPYRPDERIVASWMYLLIYARAVP